jgi:glycerol kinase
MIENIPEIKERVENNDENLCFGTIDSWLVFVFTINIEINR